MLIEKIKELKNAKNINYYDFKYTFNYHSNKIEGSTFSLEDVLKLMEYQQVQGTHKFDDVLETKNSLELFDFVSDTLVEPITKTLLLEFHSVLKKNTMDDERGFKKIPNRILGATVKVAEPHEVEPKLDELIKWWDGLKKKALINISEFHLRFETIHPFQDGNGRIGRFYNIKAMYRSRHKPHIN
jgi:Fic family protein